MLCESFDFLLPDDFLKSQICTECKKYLSCGPVKNYVTGGIKCGRCSKENDDGFVSLYDKLFEDAFFPCINRFRGCNSVMKFDNVAEHENSCKEMTASCPICNGDTELTLLSLVDHFKIIHGRNVLKEPIFTVERGDRKHYFFCDYTRNQLYIIYVHYESDLVCINASTPMGKQINQRMDIFQNYKHTYASDFVPCSKLNNNFEGLTLSAKQLNLEIIFYCRLEFIGESSPMHIILNIPSKLQVKNIQVPPNCDEMPIKIFPKFYRDEIFKQKFGQDFLNSYILIQNERVIQDVETGVFVTICCSFCENFLAPACKIRNFFFCDKCKICFCGECCSNGIQFDCPKCERGFIVKADEDQHYYYLHFYCKFGCESYFRAWELLQHEDKCKLNKTRFLSDEANIQLYFGETPEGNYSFHTDNSIVFDRSKFSKVGKMYVVTRDGFRFILYHLYREVSEFCQFKVTHKYNTSKFYILTKIYEEDGDREANESFSIFSETKLTFFVIILRPR